MLEVKELALPGVFEMTPDRFGDRRGFFSETYSTERFVEQGIDLVFIQDNHSLSRLAGVLRGLHYQLPPFAQDKLIRVVRGAILDVAVDVRRKSPTFGAWLALEVSAEKWNQILVPKGYAHGFVTLVPDTEVLYKVTARYAPAHERSIRFDDPALGIDWRVPASDITLSDKDSRAPAFADAEVFD
jgi:dTDP-4-dehydrorhamnose 3,5-epimerase